MECCKSFVRVLENVPIVGHLIATCHLCSNDKSKAERAGLKATLGFVFCICNAPAECFDEAARKRSPKLASYALTSRPEWMRMYHRQSLRQLCIPGSHQSGSFCMQRKLKSYPMVEGWSQCQTLTIGEQLMGGIRFFDLRIMTDPKDKDLWVHHQMVTCVKLRHVFDVVREFINAHQSEIVFLYITNDGKPVDWGLCRTYLQEMFSNRLIREQMKDMQIGDIIDSGRNVVVSGIPDIAYSWNSIEYRWPNCPYPDELKDDMEATLSDMSICQPQSFFWYKAECTPDKSLVSRAVGGLPGAMFCRRAKEKYDFIEDLASAANHVVQDILNQVKRLPFNVISTDFVQDDIVERIIELNGKVSIVEPIQDISMNNSADELDMFIDKGESRNSLKSAMYAPLHSTVSVNPKGRINTSAHHSNLAHNSIRSYSSLGNGGSFELPAPKPQALEVKETTI